VSLLSGPEHFVDEGVVEVEDGVEARSVVLAHVAVGACNGVKAALIGDLVASNRPVDVIMRTPEGHNGFGGVVEPGCHVDRRHCTVTTVITPATTLLSYVGITATADRKSHI
jgi:hypothetical protein